jgi:hypothetical protein
MFNAMLVLTATQYVGFPGHVVRSAEAIDIAGDRLAVGTEWHGP